jgi:hypothetical protein
MGVLIVVCALGLTAWQGCRVIQREDRLDAAKGGR